MTRYASKRLLAAAGISAALFMAGACSSKQPPPQPPVVINLNNPAPPSQGHAEKPSSQEKAAPPAIPCQEQARVKSSLAVPAPWQPAHPEFQVENMDEASFFNTQIHEMAMQLLRNFRGESGPEGPIAVATFVDLNNLYRTSPFGRYLAEQLMGELQRAGFNVIEIRKTDSIMIKQRLGEYGLSRDVQEIAKESSARYILAGTYVTRGRYIMINARMISNDNNLVASSGMKILRRDPFLDKMLWPASAPDTGPAVRLPIKELGELSEMKIMSGS